MKVILNSDIDKLGHKGDVVEVAAGFARNYLLPRNLALTATKGAVKQAESMQKARQEKEKKEVLVHQEFASKISSTPLKITMRAGDEGQLFGSVTNVDIADELTRAIEQEIDRRKITVDPIKSLGTHSFKVHLHSQVVAEGTVEVVSDVPLAPMASEETEGSETDQAAKVEAADPPEVDEDSATPA